MYGWLADASGAMASRFIVLILKKSFLGKEDHGLEANLARGDGVAPRGVKCA